LRRHVYAAWRVHATRRNVIRAAVEEFQLAGTNLATASSNGSKSSRGSKG
jgi:hypothetical protein